MKIKLVEICVFLIFFGSETVLFSQGNHRIENYGNLSILLSGNVTGSVSDLGLTYYNPGRLPVVEGNTFILNARAYQFNKSVLKNVSKDQKKIKNSEFEGLPSMIAGTFTLGKFKDSKFAYSIISRRNTDLKFSYDTGLLEGDIFESIPNDELYVGNADLSSSQRDDWFGLTWAKQYTEVFSIGVSTFLSVYKGKGSSKAKYVAKYEEDRSAAYLNNIGYEQSSIGIYWKIGLAWQFETWDLGMNIGLPYLEVLGDAEMYNEEYLAGLGAGKDIFTYNRFKDLEANRKEPISLALGAGIPIGRNKIHLNIEGYGKMGRYNRIVIPTLDSATEEPFELSFMEELKAIVNYGIGTELYFSEKVSGYLSYSSDFSAYKENANIFDLVNERSEVKVKDFINFHHFGFGVNMKMNFANLVFGATYSKGSQAILNPLELPNEDPEATIEKVAGLSISRWRIILGANIPLLNKKIREVKNGQGSNGK